MIAPAEDSGVKGPWAEISYGWVLLHSMSPVNSIGFCIAHASAGTRKLEAGIKVEHLLSIIRRGIAKRNIQNSLSNPNCTSEPRCNTEHMLAVFDKDPDVGTVNDHE